MPGDKSPSSQQHQSTADTADTPSWAPAAPASTAPGADLHIPSTYPCAEAIGGRGRDAIPALLATGAELGRHGG